jgi:hypothetical protein
MTISSAYRELSYPLPIKGGDILRTIQDARAFMLTLGRIGRCEIIGSTPVNSSWKRPNVEVVTWQFHRAVHGWRTRLD